MQQFGWQNDKSIFVWPVFFALPSTSASMDELIANDNPKKLIYKGQEMIIQEQGNNQDDVMR